MISPQSVRIMVKPVDMRLGIDRLTSLAQQTQSTSACDGLVYIFRNQSGSRIKAICWDGNGVWMSVRRLHKGKFHWPKMGGFNDAIVKGAVRPFGDRIRLAKTPFITA